MMFIEFVNSEWYDGQGVLNDRLLKPPWLKAFTRRWSSGRRRADAPKPGPLPYFEPRRGPLEENPPPAPPKPSQGLLELLELRRILRRVVETVAEGREISTSDIRHLNGFLEKADVRYRMHKTRNGLGLEEVPLVGDDEWLVGAIALSTAEFLVSGDLMRLKVCGNPGCRWVFYDETKNRSRRWCDSTLCGNLFKVRRHRSRLRGAREERPGA